jgi:hypothetical protein
MVSHMRKTGAAVLLRVPIFRGMKMQFLKSAWNGVKSGFRKVAQKAETLAIALGTAVASAVGLSKPAEAAGPDLTSLTTAVDFGTVTTAILAVSAAIIVVYIAWKGAKMVIHAVKGS